MKKMFSYRLFNDEKFDSLVETFNLLVEKYSEGKSNTPEYNETNAKFTENFMKVCMEAIPGYSFRGLEDVKNPMINKNLFFLNTFNTILAQAITPAVPVVASNDYNQLYDVTQVGFGDNAKYTVESNELYIVNSIAEGVARGGVQTIANNEYSVTASRKQIAIYVDWYLVAAKKLNFGKMGQKIGASFMAYIQAKTASAMASVITANSNPSAYATNPNGIAGYIANGMTVENWLTTSRNVRLANGGADVYGLGTAIALADVLPAESATSGFRYGEDSEIVKKGFLPSYKDVPLIELGNALVPNTVNSTPEVVLPDDIVYLIPMGMNKPVKVVFEGDTVTVSQDPLFSADHCYGMTVDMRIGVDVVVGSKFGAIQLS